MIAKEKVKPQFAGGGLGRSNYDREGKSEAAVCWRRSGQIEL